MPMITLETVDNHRMYCLMSSDNFIVKKSRTQAGIEPTTFGVLTLTFLYVRSIHELYKEFINYHN